MKELSDEQMSAVTRLPAPARYSHFLKRVVGENRAWGLWQEGWAMMSDDGGGRVLPLWP